MDFYVIRGNSSPYMPETFVSCIENFFSDKNDSGYMHLGCPLGVNADNKITADALLVTKNCGVIVFIFHENLNDLNKIKSENDAMYNNVYNYFSYHPAFWKGRGKLKFDYKVISILPQVPTELSNFEFDVDTIASIPRILTESEGFSEETTYQKVLEVLQNIQGLKPRSARKNVDVGDGSFGGKIKRIENELSNLDKQQMWAASEVVEGPQRIRGIAGSGKTIILALKAAYLHSQHPDWKIGVTFWSRSLRQQFRNLIGRFYQNYNAQRGDIAQPDWDKVLIRHAWGARDMSGLYRDACNKTGNVFLNFSNSSFANACETLLPNLKDEHADFDAILIDEAQDLPASFFKMVYRLTKKPKRIIWAYDELQSLNSLDMPSLEELFGTDDNGESLITLSNEHGKPKQDISLYVCYRNPIWSLTVAHALGFGIYRDGGLIQMFENAESWENVGYNVIEGKLDSGQEVSLQRTKDSMPQYFNELLTPDECIQVKKFDTPDDQYEWVATEIKKNLKVDKLLPEDIVVVLLSSPSDGSFPYRAYDELKFYLNKKRILSLGPKERDVFKRSNHITCAQIFRAKGNEAPMVYVINADTCAGGNAAMRNRLFTAITRSKAWVRITGTGNAMDDILKEIELCRENNFCLKFQLPADEQAENIRHIHSDDISKQLQRVFEAMDNGEFSITELFALAGLLSKQGDRKKLQQKIRSANRKHIINLTDKQKELVDQIYIPKKRESKPKKISLELVTGFDIPKA